MSTLRQRRPRRRLDRAAYAELRRKVLMRDGWRCQQCGCSTNLQVHHVRSRSDLGDDIVANLITLCVDCHRALHPSGRRKVKNEFR